MGGSTSYERYQESGLDQALFRYYSPRIGRFMSADPIGGSLVDPQSLNRYAYVRNAPSNLVDVFGLFYFWFCRMGPGVITPHFEPNPGDDEPSYFTVRSYDACELMFFGPFEGTEDVFTDEFERARKLIDKQECIDFLKQVIQRATLAAAGKTERSQLGPGEQAIFDTTPSEVLGAAKSAELIEKPNVDPTEGDFRTAATADFFASPKSITLYSAFYEQTTKGKAQIFLHEGVHLVFPFSDAQLAAAAGVPAKPNENSSNNFQKKLNENCK